MIGIPSNTNASSLMFNPFVSPKFALYSYTFITTSMPLRAFRGSVVIALWPHHWSIVLLNNISSPDSQRSPTSAINIVQGANEQFKASASRCSRRFSKFAYAVATSDATFSTLWR